MMVCSPDPVSVRKNENQQWSLMRCRWANSFCPRSSYELWFASSSNRPLWYTCPYGRNLRQCFGDPSAQTFDTNEASFVEEEGDQVSAYASNKVMVKAMNQMHLLLNAKMVVLSAPVTEVTKP
ncbi:hypothetical protein Bca101_011406 [Brassica carinata]